MGQFLWMTVVPLHACKWLPEAPSVGVGTHEIIPGRSKPHVSPHESTEANAEEGLRGNPGEHGTGCGLTEDVICVVSTVKDKRDWRSCV